MMMVMMMMRRRRRRWRRGRRSKMTSVLHVREAVKNYLADFFR